MAEPAAVAVRRAGPDAATAAQRPRGRGLAAACLLALALAAAGTQVFVYRFGQHRFFTIDEYQFGHATWLVGRGRVPYRDFYEHHFPGSYLLHAALLPDAGCFGERALALRRIVSGYWLALAVGLAACIGWATRQPYLALLSACLPFALGFGLMSAVDYRADNFGAALFLGALALAEANQRLRSRVAALCAGLLGGLSVAMTQKLGVVAGASFGGIWLLDQLHARSARNPQLAFPLAFLGGAALPLLGLVGLGAALGVLPQAFEITVRQALLHERLYPEVSLWKWLRPYLEATPVSSSLVAATFSLWLLGPARRTPIWLVPAGVVVAAGVLLETRYPYNYVLPSLLLGLGAVRGWAFAVEGLARRPALARLRPLLYLLPLALLPAQLGFVGHTTSNRNQLLTLNEIEAATAEGDAVIDGAGGAMFREHASYFWYHGVLQHKLYADYFAGPVLDDYRRSRALFWIHDKRQAELPAPVGEYFRRHYVPVNGQLHALGFRTPPTGSEALALEVEVIRPGTWYLQRLRPEGGGGLRVDGTPVRDAVVLAEGAHRLEVLPGSPALLLSPLPPEVFRRGRSRPPSVYTRFFEYEPRRAQRARRRG
jgi:hypothetical protein